MGTQQLVNHQIKVKITNNLGVITIALPNNQTFEWPVKDLDIPTGEFYITLSPTPTLPNKEDLPRLVLKEILQKTK